jgi:hypothetical protein
MGKRRRKYKRRREPGWYKDQKGKKYAVRVTVLSLLAMLLLVIIVPVVFYIGGGYDAMAGDTVVKDFTSAGDFDRWGLSWWAGQEFNISKMYVTNLDAGSIAGLDNGDWFYPKEQNETYSSLVIDCPTAECSDTNGDHLSYTMYLNVSVADLLDSGAAYMRVGVRLSMVGSFHLESRLYEGSDRGFWVDSDSSGVRPDMFLSKQNVDQELDGTNWTWVNYPFSRAQLLQANSELGSGTQEKFTMAVNITNSSVAPDGFDGEVLDWEVAFYSAGGGVKMAGEFFGWGMGGVLLISAFASTPYWNPTREKRRRKWRRGRRWYR